MQKNQASGVLPSGWRKEPICFQSCRYNKAPESGGPGKAGTCLVPYRCSITIQTEELKPSVNHDQQERGLSVFLSPGPESRSQVKAVGLVQSSDLHPSPLPPKVPAMTTSSHSRILSGNRGSRHKSHGGLREPPKLYNRRS